MMHRSMNLRGVCRTAVPGIHDLLPPSLKPGSSDSYTARDTFPVSILRLRSSRINELQFTHGVARPPGLSGSGSGGCGIQPRVDTPGNALRDAVPAHRLLLA